MKTTHKDSRKDIWKTYFFWFLVINLAFLSTYPLCNWIASQRPDTVGLYLDAELRIPFVPQFIWPYFSMNLLFAVPPFLLNVAQLQALGKRLLAGTLWATLIFLAVPTRLGFSRVVPTDPQYQSIFSGLFAVDHPHNLVPSLHIVYGALTVFTYVGAVTSVTARLAWLGWLVLIMASTVLVHQHHLTDILTGLLLAAVLHYRAAAREGKITNDNKMPGRILARSMGK